MFMWFSFGSCFVILCLLVFRVSLFCFAQSVVGTCLFLSRLCL